MNAYERNLLTGIPQDEASSYFLRLTGRAKLAASNLEDAWNELPAEEQDVILKEAAETGLLDEKLANAMMGGKMGAPPAPASMPAPSPVSLPATAQGMNTVKTASPDPGGMAPPRSEQDDPSLEEYLRNEAMGSEAEEIGGASFYRQRLQQAMAELDQTKQQADETSMKAQELEATVGQNDQAIQSAMQQAQMAQQTAMTNVQQAHEMAMQATNQAMESQSEVLRQKQLAAAMRMGVQTLKDNVMNAMAQDPTDQLAQQLQSPPPGSMGAPVGGQPPPPPPQIDPMTGQPMVDPMMAGQDPNAAKAQGGAPAGPPQGGGEKKAPSGEGEKKEKSESKDSSKSEKKDDKKSGGTHVEVKTGSVLRFLELTKDLRKA